MNSLNAVLQKHHVPAAVLASKTIDREMLRRDLTDLRAHLRTMAWITAGMILVVFASELALAVMYVKSPAVLAKIAAAIGLTVGGAIEGMRRLAGETARTHLLLTLASGLKTDQIANIVNELVTERRTKSSTPQRKRR